LKSAGVLKSDQINDGVIYEAENETNPTVVENEMKFNIDWEGGQKTGFFVDQRDNRELVKKLAKDKHVLNTFCYTGGFSIAAYKGGAKSVTSVDSSKLAIEQCRENLQLNACPIDNCVVEDTFQFLKSDDTAYDLVILDPPAYAKNMKAKHNAVQGYKRLNAEAMRKIASGGILLTFSCSGVITRGLFENTIIAAAISVGRSARILYHLSQPADHPVNVYHQEGEYLKGLVLEID
ncbi:MAG: class I SAM-dependent methyltransferase, partial [Fulvivirga sp.]|nr:class I SAM-dependent methyltransferase [Fulvivirga sp.]